MIGDRGSLELLVGSGNLFTHACVKYGSND